MDFTKKYSFWVHQITAKHVLYRVYTKKARLKLETLRDVTFNEQKMFNNISLSAGQARLEQEADLNHVAFLGELINDNVIPKSTEALNDT